MASTFFLNERAHATRFRAGGVPIRLCGLEARAPSIKYNVCTQAAACLGSGAAAPVGEGGWGDFKGGQGGTWLFPLGPPYRFLAGRASNCIYSKKATGGTWLFPLGPPYTVPLPRAGREQLHLKQKSNKELDPLMRAGSPHTKYVKHRTGAIGRGFHAVPLTFGCATNQRNPLPALTCFCCTLRVNMA